MCNKQRVKSVILLFKGLSITIGTHYLTTVLTEKWTKTQRHSVQNYTNMQELKRAAIQRFSIDLHCMK